MSYCLMTVVEKAMKRQDVMLQAYAKKITWIQAAEILGVSCRQLRRQREKYEEFGFEGLFDRRRSQESPRRMPVVTVERVLELYRDVYFDLNMSHFHEKLREVEKIEVSYTWLRMMLQGAGLVAKERPRKKHRKRRERKPLTGMMLHIDGSQHRWLGDERYFDLIAVLDDATGEVYHVRLVPQESTATVMEALRDVVEKKGVFCSLYSDRASHFFVTPKVGEPVDRQALTQVGRALRELGVRLIPAYSPQARGRSERGFRTWQGRLPQELRLRAITEVGEANRFLRDEYVKEYNRRFAVPAAEPGQTAFVPCRRRDLDLVFSIQTERTVNRDNTVKYRNMTLQIDEQVWRRSMEGCRVTVHQHHDGRLTLVYGPQTIGRYDELGRSLKRASPTTKPARTTASHVKNKSGHFTCQ
jgi:hypothetical protein